MPTTKQQCTEVRCLLDANAWPDAILGRAGGAETVRLLDGAEGQLATNDFTLHAIVLYLETIRSFPRLLEDLIKRKVNTLHLPASSLFTALDVMRLHGLDFDDAFQ